MIRSCLAGLLLLGLIATAQATDLLRVGAGARSQGAGGVAGLEPDLLAGATGNPALLAVAPPGLALGVSLLQVDSRYTSKLNQSDQARRGPGLLPEVAVSHPLAATPFTLGAAISVQSAMLAEFEFNDPPGTAGVSYGNQLHRAAYVVARIDAMLAWQVSPTLALGAGVGLAYNRNELEAPYIFQSHPLLKGLKVLVDLDADATSITGNLGLHYVPPGPVAFTLSWQPAVDFAARGSLHGNLGQLGLGIADNFSYRSRVSTTAPETLTAGLTWQLGDRWRLGLQYDRIDWEDAFASLPLDLRDGSNAQLNAFLGSNRIVDVAPLDWNTQQVWHAGVRYQTRHAAVIRLGIERGEVPVPRATMTPMTAALFESAAAIGTTIRLGDQEVDLAWRRSWGRRTEVEWSGLAGGEYTGSRQDLRLDALSLSVTF